MEVNKDPTLVVMSRAAYDKLISGRCGLTAAFAKHLRKFNTALAQERQAEVQDEINDIREAKKKAKDFTLAHEGRVVFRRIYGDVWQPGIVMGRDHRTKMAVRLRLMLSSGEASKDAVNVSPDGLITEMDPYWVMIRDGGPQDGCYKKPEKNNRSTVFDPRPGDPPL
jgi:hypothetical protein